MGTARVSSGDWDRHKPKLHRLYMIKDTSMDELKTMMENEDGFAPTKRQYHYQLYERWRWSKYKPAKLQGGGEPQRPQEPPALHKADFDLALFNHNAAFERYVNLLEDLDPIWRDRVVVPLARCATTVEQKNKALGCLKGMHPRTCDLSCPKSCRYCLLKDRLQRHSQGEGARDTWGQSKGGAAAHCSHIASSQLEHINLSMDGFSLDLISVQCIISNFDNLDPQSVAVMMETILKNQPCFNNDDDSGESDVISCILNCFDWCIEKLNDPDFRVPPAFQNLPQGRGSWIHDVRLFTALWDRWHTEDGPNSIPWSQCCWPTLGISASELLFYMSSLFLNDSTTEKEGLDQPPFDDNHYDAALFERAKSGMRTVRSWSNQKLELCAQTACEFVWLNGHSWMPDEEDHKPLEEAVWRDAGHYLSNLGDG
ncbi:uncharacterized protein BCR38DRAFT_408784 [Pseudomassariella vexata]|uniref:Clr5 domain-containing protein n=1 Tax=Pseudomassariella vexata TaxID=1141098 RepID=A0A1Y2E0N5_9PEZI|nr:uncharacterized protein BCR38DRAFT_408784 [Pseudomassariella vexata]ORY65039.1 hypothetical protein BCR38DRAFT_408784 [Pseudomassariella vexata]